MASMSITRLALFDLDHTLLPIDSADGWSHFLVHAASLDAAHHGAHFSDQIRRFAADYKDGRFDVEGYLTFQMGLLARFPRTQLELWRAAYLRVQVFPQMRFESQTLVEKHRSDGYTVAIVTGTHSFVTRPIAALFGIEHLIAVQPEEEDGEFTGRYLPPHTYQEGKVRATEAFLAQHGTVLDQLEDSVFFSDSINDLPLLERVRRPVVTNGDARLKAIAAERGWETLELFDLVQAA
jgi:HAD superfamily hydrolase (TIGR01490 family)